MGPDMLPSTRVRLRASPNWVRLQPNGDSSATAQRVIAWNIGTAVIIMMNPPMTESHQP